MQSTSQKHLHEIKNKYARLKIIRPIKLTSNLRMRHSLKCFVKQYPWVQFILGLFGNFIFFIGSILSLPQLDISRTTIVICFITGSFFMLIGAIGRLIVDVSNGNS